MENKILSNEERNSKWEKMKELGVDNIFLNHLFKIQKTNKFKSTTYMPDITDFEKENGYKIDAINVIDAYWKKSYYKETELVESNNWFDVWREIDKIIVEQSKFIDNGDWLPLLYNMWLVTDNNDSNTLIIDCQLHHIT